MPRTPDQPPVRAAVSSRASPVPRVPPTTPRPFSGISLTARPGPLPAPLRATLGAAILPLYTAAIRRRNARFDRDEGVTRLDVPVISIGNLSVGGTGKTPMVMLILRELLAMGKRPCIAMRGYSKGRAKRRDAEDAPCLSDEADEYARALPGVPIVAQPDRLAGLHALLRSPGGHGVDCVVLDDGFQHRQIARDLDIVLLDASRDAFSDQLLPVGWLREPVSSLGRAQVVVLTHAELARPDALMRMQAQVRSVNMDAVIAIARHEWRALILGDSVNERTEPISWLACKRVIVTCGIGNPDAFLAAAQHAGAEVAAQLILPDHDPYRPRTVARLIGMIDAERRRSPPVEAVVTTQKDWSKLRLRPIDWPLPVVRPELSIGFASGGPEVSRLIARALSAQAG